MRSGGKPRQRQHLPVSKETWGKINRELCTMLINITQKDGTTIETKDKHVSDNLTVVPVLDEVNATPSESTQTFTPGTGFAGFDKVIVAPIPSEYVKPEGTLDVTENGTQDVTNYKNVNVNVEPNLEQKTVTITENGTTEVTPTTGKDGLSKVTVITNVPTASAVEEVATAAAMDALLVEANVGKYYKFTGTTDTNYTNGDLYLVEGAVTEHHLNWENNAITGLSVNGVGVQNGYLLKNGDVITFQPAYELTDVNNVTYAYSDGEEALTFTITNEDIFIKQGGTLPAKTASYSFTITYQQ